MRINADVKKRPLFFLAFVAVIGALLLFVFRNFGQYFNRQLVDVQSQSLTAYAQEMELRLKTEFARAGSSMRGAANWVVTTNADPGSPEFTEYLNRLNDGAIQNVHYMTVGAWAQKSGQSHTPGQVEIYRAKLQSGQDILSDVQRDGSGCYLWMDSPVLIGDRLNGVLRCRLDLIALLKNGDQPPMAQTVTICLSDPHGGILYCQDDRYEGKNVFAPADPKLYAPGAAETLRTSAQNRVPCTVALPAPRVGYFVTLIPFSGGQWNLVLVTCSPALQSSLRSISRTVELLAIFLLLLFAVSLGMFLWFLDKEHSRERRNEVRYTLLADFSDIVLFQYDIAADTIHFTPNIRKSLQLTELTYPNFSKTERFATLRPEDGARVREGLAALRAGADEYRLELPFYPPDGKVRWFECYVRALREHGALREAMGRLTDITARKTNELDLVRQSTADTLTGLLNRMATERQINEQLARQPEGTLFMLDVDNFKSINDRLGHAEGDRVLKEVAAALTRTFRSGDLIGRPGGDEFVVFLPGVDDPAVISRIYGDLRAALQTILITEEHPLTVSMGAAMAPDAGRSFAALFAAADAAMYGAKKNGKDQFSIA